jgi:hypothetical protein
MQKYDLNSAYDGVAELIEPRDDGKYYLASEVDARIAELKQWLEQEIDLHPSQYPDFTGGYCSALEDVLKKFNALMER